MSRKKKVNYFDNQQDIENNDNKKLNKGSKSSDVPAGGDASDESGWIPYKRREKYKADDSYADAEGEAAYSDGKEYEITEKPDEEDSNGETEELSESEQKRLDKIKNIVDKNVVLRRRFYFILVGVIFAVGILFACYRYLRAERIIINGNETLSDEYIAGLSGIEKGQHFLTINRENVINNLESNPYIKVTGVSFNFPNVLKINIKERKAVGMIEMGTQYMILDEDAYILSVTNANKSKKLPLITGMGVKLAEIGTELRTNDDAYKLVVAKDIMHYIDLNGMSKIVSVVDLSDINSITLSVSSGITLKLGQGDRINSKLAWANTIIQTINEEGTYSGVIDVSTEGVAIYEKQENQTPDDALNAGTYTEDD